MISTRYTVLITAANIAILALVFFYSRQIKLEKQSAPMVLDSNKANVDVHYIDLLEKNLVNNIAVNTAIYAPTNTTTKYSLLFISTKEDCSTCIDQEIQNLIKIYGAKLSNVVFVSDSVHFQMIDARWDDRIYKAKRIIASIDDIKSKYYYNNHPRYILLENTGRSVFSMEIDASYPTVTVKALKAIFTLL